MKTRNASFALAAGLVICGLGSVFALAWTGRLESTALRLRRDAEFAGTIGDEYNQPFSLRVQVAAVKGPVSSLLQNESGEIAIIVLNDAAEDVMFADISFGLKVFAYAEQDSLWIALPLLVKPQKEAIVIPRNTDRLDPLIYNSWSINPDADIDMSLLEGEPISIRLCVNGIVLRIRLDGGPQPDYLAVRREGKRAPRWSPLALGIAISRARVRPWPCGWWSHPGTVSGRSSRP